MKNGYMKKSFSILLCLSLLGAMLLACVGCGGKPSVVGDWECEIDFTDDLTKILEESINDDEAMKYIKIGKFSMELSLSLDKDGEYTMAIDEEKLKEAVNSLVDDLKVGMRDYFEKMISDEGLDMGVDDFFALMAGVSYDEYMDEIMDISVVMSQFEGLEDNGTYKVDGDELVLKSENGDKQTYTFELNESTLTLDSDEEFELDIFPLELEKK